MKILFATFLLATTNILFSQTGFIGQRLYGPNMTNQWYVQNSPGNTFATSKLIAEFRDSLYFRILYNTFRVDYLGSSNNTYIKTDNLGNFSTGLLTDIFNPSDYYNKTQSDGRFLQSFMETDPIFIGDSSFFARKTYSWSKNEADSRFLQNYTETDPLFNTKF
jgi:hypothetical protein